MNGYPTSAREMRSIPLYQHDQLPPYSSPSKRASHSGGSEQQQSSSSSTSMPSELQDVIFCYQSQPELLRLILQSKLEEDKRRAEEAKLRSKELDLIMLQQKTTAAPAHPTMNDDTTRPIRHSSSNLDAGIDSAFPPPPPPPSARRSSLLPPSMTAHTTAFTPVSNNSHIDEHQHVSVIPSCTSSLSSSSMPATPATVGTMFHHQQPSNTTATTTTTTAAAAAIYSMEKATTLSPLMDDHGMYDLPAAGSSSNTATSTPPSTSYHPLPAIRRYDPYFTAQQQRPRRRREMQAITKIVETREYPYLDGFSWKNNGNTVQKKTGNKSVYYKCSNSMRGCPVNKTVTWKNNGEYLIKYRGEHLPDCNRTQQM